MERATIESYLKLSDDELYMQLGEAIIIPVLSASEPSRFQLITRGKNWIEKHRNELCQEFSESERVRDFILKGKAYDRVEAVGMICDLIVAVNNEIPVVIPAILIVRNGIAEMCREGGYFSSGE